MFYRENSKMDDSDSDSDESDYEIGDNELYCKNINPALAKLMGIIIEEQKEIDWKPPLKNGLDNSEQIISSNHFKDKSFINNDIDYFKVIKDDILNHKFLNDKQLEYIKNLNNQDKFELIQIYNKLINVTNKRLS
jgi:hypothetical protein